MSRKERNRFYRPFYEGYFMQVAVGTASSRSINIVTKKIIKDVIEDINGVPDFLLVGFTPNYKSKRQYEQALEKLCEESGTKKIMGGTFPAVTTSNDYPTIQGCSVMAIKSNELEIDSPLEYTNIRIKPKKGAQQFAEKIKRKKKKSKIGLFLTPGPFFQKNAIEQMKVLDTFFAHKFKKMFNFIGKQIDKKLGKDGYGTTLFADKILKVLEKYDIKSVIGGATIDLFMKSCYQFQEKNVFQNALVGTVFSSDKLIFNHSWAFDKSKKSKQFDITEFLKSSGYVQSIDRMPANKSFLDLIDIPENIYNEAFRRFSYASLLYLSAIKQENNEALPFVSMCNPILKGIITTIPERHLTKNNLKADLFTQSGKGIQDSAFECAKNASQGLYKSLFGVFINCSNRLLIAGDKINKENDKIKQALGEDVPFITFYSGGEFSLINKKPIFSAVSVHGFVAGKEGVHTKNVVF
ncbi:MAG: FIST N-terminal domain-containing protein [Candidatus Heimdallarchaeaceae archaeon]